MEKIISAEDYPTIIHGTNLGAWNSIAHDPKGLRRMNRNHMHFATGLLGQDGVISGMRQNCTVLIYVDLHKALDAGVEFFKSENGVVLTEGIDGTGCLPKEYFKTVVSNKGMVLWPLKPEL
jgi:2'-phosphotransferase